MERKQFIAGATCPKCSSKDTIYIYFDANLKWRKCTRCPFNEPLKNKDSNVDEIPTRVNQARFGEPTLPHETPLEAIKLVDPKD
jgi:uncharacterized metal-binding protein (TIGR02443 family)